MKIDSVNTPLPEFVILLEDYFPFIRALHEFDELFEGQRNYGDYGGEQWMGVIRGLDWRASWVLSVVRVQHAALRHAVRGLEMTFPFLYRNWDGCVKTCWVASHKPCSSEQDANRIFVEAETSEDRDNRPVAQ